MIGLPEILIIFVLFLLVAGPVAAGVVIWKYVIKPKENGGNSRERNS
jgi:hypothetical protein